MIPADRVYSYEAPQALQADRAPGVTGLLPLHEELVGLKGRSHTLQSNLDVCLSIYLFI